MSIHFDLLHGFIFFSGLCLILYGAVRWGIAKQYPKNPALYHLPMGMVLLGLGVSLFGGSFFYPGAVTAHTTFLTALAAGLQMLGYAQLIAIPCYVLLPRRTYIITKYTLFLFALALTMAAVIFQPAQGASFSDLSFAIGIGISFLEEAALLFNAVLLIYIYRKLKKFSWGGAIPLIIGYLFAAPSSTYLYFGQNEHLLEIAAAGLLVGMILLLSSVLAERKETPIIASL